VIGIFAGKRTAGTLPDGVDARYLLGIVTEALIRERLAARDRFLEPLVLERDAILAAERDRGATLIALVARLVRAERTLDRYVWLDAAAALVVPCAHDERVALARRAASTPPSISLHAIAIASSARSCAGSGRSSSCASPPARSSSRLGRHAARKSCRPLAWHLTSGISHLTPCPTRPPFPPGR
jgi:hypothetical protein